MEKVEGLDPTAHDIMNGLIKEYEDYYNASHIPKDEQPEQSGDQAKDEIF